MRRSLINLAKRTIMLAVFAVIAGGASFGQDIEFGKDAESSHGAGRLVGTWDALVTIRNCANGDAIRSFQSVGSFNKGGTFSGITSGTPPTLRTSERGVWKRLRANRYRFRFKAYLYNPDAVATGYQIVTQDLRLNNDNVSYTSAGTTQIFTLDGVEIGSGCSTTVGSRLVLD